MFDTYIQRPGRSYHETHSTVTEKRAPTDASVSLLREMEEAALSKLVQAGELKNNVLEASWHVFTDLGNDFHNCTVILSVVLNGEKREVRFKMPRNDYHDWTPTDRVQKTAELVRQKLTEELARILTVDMFRASAECRTMIFGVR